MRQELDTAPYVVDDQIGFVLRLAIQFHTAIFLSSMVEGLTQTQFAVLVTLYQSDALSQSDLGRLLQLDSATINGVVDRLRVRGLITMSDDSSDRRRHLVALTCEGSELAAKAVPVAHEITKATAAKLTATETARLIQLLRKMIGQTV